MKQNREVQLHIQLNYKVKCDYVVVALVVVQYEIFVHDTYFKKHI